MSKHHPSLIFGYHSCDSDLGLAVLNGQQELIPSDNNWDWLGPGIYFWEHDPQRALVYARENAEGKQFNKKKIADPFVLGAIIELGECLNLVESESLAVLSQAYKGLVDLYQVTRERVPENNGSNRALDCAVIRYIHESRRVINRSPYHTVRAAFMEGEEAYPTASFYTRHHIQVAVLDPSTIRGYFLHR